MKLKLTICVLLSLIVTGAAIGQETTGVIRGEVADPTGASIPNTTVEISGPALLQSRTVKTDASGAYTFPALPPGIYVVSVTAQGFAPVKRVNIDLQVGRVLRIDFKLEVSGVTQTVEVVSEAAIVDTAQTTVAQNVTSTMFDHLPKGRDFASLIAMAPGARYETKAGGFQVDGASSGENIYIIDGMDQTNLQTGALPDQARFPTEFVQEMQIKSSGFDAEYGGAVGGVVNVITRSGSNSFHGDGGFYFFTDGMRAMARPYPRVNPLDNNKGEYFLDPRTDNRLWTNPYVTLGGPLKKDRLWFFAGWSPQRDKYERSVTFLRDNSTRQFEQRIYQDYLVGRLDAAPSDKLRLYGSYTYSPYKRNGTLPGYEGTGDPNADYTNPGIRQPATGTKFGGDYNFTPKLIASVQAGYDYRNSKDYGVRRGAPYYYYTASSVGMAGVPAGLQAATGAFTTNNRQTTKDIATRWRLSATMAYFFNAGGQHNLKFGYETNRLHNSPNASTWPDGYYRIGWGRAYSGVTRPDTVKGTYGYLLYRYFSTTGDAGSTNTGFFVQDGWQVSKRLRLNLGLRTEREFLPSFSSTAREINFGFGQKLAPRLGVAYDLLGDARFKVYASFGRFYDLMKYEMPRGSFGGDVWHDYVYPLNDPNILSLTHSADSPLPNRNDLFEVVDWRIPSNDPSDYTVDPDLKPMSKQVWDAGFDWAINPQFAFSVRYTHNTLRRTIEDVGTLGPQGEKYYIANPGFGLTADPATWDTGFPVTPKAQRKYDGLEFRLEKRFAKNYMFSTSYTWSRLWGNYGGLSSSDENGRMSPNVNRYFDLPFMSYDKSGKEVLGLLATDRPHSFKFFGSYVLKTKMGETNFGPYFQMMSGTPATTEVSMVSSVPIFVNGRGDMGRTPFYTRTDMLVYHEFRIGERYRVKFDANFENLFNHARATDLVKSYLHSADGQINFEHQADFFKGFDYEAMRIAQGLRVNPIYGWKDSLQSGRAIRLGLHFSF